MPRSSSHLSVARLALAAATALSLAAPAATLFLASDAAQFISGVEFPVDGGRTV